MNADMQLMIDYTDAILDSICDFLMQPPVFYLFSLIFFALVCKMVKMLIT